MLEFLLQTFPSILTPKNSSADFLRGLTYAVYLCLGSTSQTVYPSSTPSQTAWNPKPMEAIRKISPGSPSGGYWGFDVFQFFLVSIN